MLQIIEIGKRGLPLVGSALMMLAAVFLGGCGKNSDTSVSSVPPRPRTEHKAAAGKAIDKVSIDQLVLDSPIIRKNDRNGLEFMHFKYTDNDGKVYKCVLPAAMAEGDRTLSEWVSAFNVYRKPQVLAQKEVSTRKGEKLSDFPFISPRPEVREQKKEAPKRPRPSVALPALPAAPTPSTTRRGTMPGRPGMPGMAPMPGQNRSGSTPAQPPK